MALAPLTWLTCPLAKYSATAEPAAALYAATLCSAAPPAVDASLLAPGAGTACMGETRNLLKLPKSRCVHPLEGVTSHLLLA